MEMVLQEIDVYVFSTTRPHSCRVIITSQTTPIVVSLRVTTATRLATYYCFVTMAKEHEDPTALAMRVGCR